MNKNEAMTYANPGVQMQSSQRQEGALLPLTLVILLVVTILGLNAISSTNVDLQIAGNQQRQLEAEMVAENAVNFLAENYPSNTMPTNADFKTFEFDMVQGTPAQACVTKTIIAGSGTPGSLECGWQGGNSPGVRASDSITDHEEFRNGTSGKSCMVGNYIEEEHPHLHHLDDDGFSPIELWINGNVTIKKCGGCFKKVNATINYTGQIITEGNNGTCSHGSEDFEGDWPSNITKNNVTQAEFNDAADAGPLVGGDYYSHVKIRVTTTDPNSGATATAVKGLKYRGDDTDSTTIGSPTDTNCEVDDASIAEVAEDPDLTENGSKKVLYSYLEID
jgi:hypothetical protein